MGNSSSTAGGAESTPEEKERRLREREEQEERNRQKKYRQELEKHGILIPPCFGVANEAVIPPSALGRLSKILPSSFIANVQARMPSDHILKDYLMPGLFVGAVTEPLQGSVLASCDLTDRNRFDGTLQVSSINGSFMKTDIRASTTGPPSVLNRFDFVPGLTLRSALSFDGSVAVGCNVDVAQCSRGLGSLRRPSRSRTYYRNDPFPEDDEKTISEIPRKNVQLGSWVLGNASSPSKISVDSVSAYGALEFPSGIAAMEGSFSPSEPTSKPDLSYLVSMDLGAGSSGPPLIVSLRQTPQDMSMSLSQIVTFDRIVMNVFETRCPRIRNTLGWAIQMNKPLVESSSTLSGALAWQVNRNVCLKLKGVASESQGAHLTAGVIFKRWAQPRVTCSVLCRASSSSGTISFGGIGLELESGPHPPVTKDTYGGVGDDKRHLTSDDSPATKATLPGANHGPSN